MRGNTLIFSGVNLDLGRDDDREPSVVVLSACGNLGDDFDIVECYATIQAMEQIISKKGGEW